LIKEINSAQDVLLFSGQSQTEPYNISKVLAILDKIIAVLKGTTAAPVAAPAPAAASAAAPAAKVMLPDNKGKRETALGGKKRTKRYKKHGGKKAKHTRKHK